ncbi:MAG TPA: alanine--tRNA ligase [Candidatus Thalassarchaeaceae archaeon]|nr:alanine--tRNA ligase [Candidatus Thalassarchaeaceae archaeon]
MFGEIDIPFWKESGHICKICEVTNARFWTRDDSRSTCGDSSEDPYTFIGEPIIDGFPMRGKALKDAMRESFLSFFENNGHTRVEPYPIVARWRDDIHLTIASIADFQPHVTSGLVPPPANPLGISQPCIRLTDVDAVGRSGRHLSTFEMMAHHAFNRPKDDQVVYWIDQCVRFCDKLLVDSFGISPEEITYVENPWSGGGNAGPALEVIAGGLELATLVFMNLEESEDGEIEIKGLSYREMDLQIIDTGYGLERFCWAAAGTPTIYDAIYPDSISRLKEASGFDNRTSSLDLGVEIDTLLSELSCIAGILNIDVGTDAQGLYENLVNRLADSGIELSVSDLKLVTEPLSAIYAIPDHMHALCNMLGDGLVPSNSKAGYLARMLARRVCRMKDQIGANVSLSDLGAYHMEINMDQDSVMQSREGILAILELEEYRYHEMLRKGEAAVRTALREIPIDAIEIPDEILFRLAEERGLNPEMTVSIAHDLGWERMAVRVGFSADMAARNALMAKAASKPLSRDPIIEKPPLPITSQDYYGDTNATEFSSQVLHCASLSPEAIDSFALSSEVLEEPKHAVILSNTLFYPEGGGQLGDQGFLNQGGLTARVLDTRIEDGVVMHLTDTPLENAPVNGVVDWDRRKQLMDHHTAVHIVGGSAREILGPHVWQAGSNKGARYARLDITHHSRLTREQLDEIEDMANSIIEANPKVEKLVLEREDADRRFGFSIYQGGPPKNNPIRVIRIGDFDTQACGGTHHDETGSIGDLHIIRASQVQDGVERLQIVAGETAREYTRNQARLLNEASEILGVNPDDLPRSVARFFDEWKSQQKRIENLEAEVIRLRAGGGGAAVEKNGIRYVVMEVSGGNKQLMAMLGELTRDPGTPTVAVLGSRDSGGYLVVACTEGTVAEKNLDAVQIINTIATNISGSGGGRATMAQAGGNNPEGVPKALDAAREILGL